MNYILNSTKRIASKTMFLFLMSFIGFGSVKLGYYLLENIEQKSYEMVSVFLLLIAVSNIIAKLLSMIIRD